VWKRKQKRRCQIDLREDEIEALLKFDGARLGVIPLTERGGQFLVLLHLYEGAPVRVLHATDTVRINAVRAVWDKYNRMKEEEKKNPPATSMAWYHLEEARANIEMMLANKIFTKRQERQHERNEARSIGKPHRSR
jgi:hypothetical protein